MFNLYLGNFHCRACKIEKENKKRVGEREETGHRDGVHNIPFNLKPPEDFS
jgi:hypothetical protein